jgi:nuclear pore complex protein Nup62
VSKVNPQAFVLCKISRLIELHELKVKMSDPPKSAPFSFGQTSTSGTTSSLLAPKSSDNENTQRSLFGTSAGAPSTNPNPFGSNPATSASSLFGQVSSSAQASSTFGGLGSKPSRLLGAGNKPSSSLFNFGPAPQNDTSGAATSPGFTSFLTPNKLSEPSTTGPSQTANSSGEVTNTGNGSFLANFNASAAPASQPGASTPTSKLNTGFSFATSTTPAGPPPSLSGAGGNSVPGFSLGKTQAPNKMSFGAAFTSQPTTQSSAAPSNAFSGFPAASGGAFGPKKSAESDSSNRTPSNTPLFGKLPSGPGANMFDTAGKTPSSGGGIFENLNQPKDKDANSPFVTTAQVSSTSAAQQPSTAAAKSPSLFPALGSQVSSAHQGFGGLSQTVTTGVSMPSLFPSTAASQAGPIHAMTASGTASGFSLKGAGETSGPSAPHTTAPSSGLFSHLNPTKSSTPNPGTISAQHSLPASSAKSHASSSQGQEETSGSAPAAEKPATTQGPEKPGNLGAGLGTSMSGPAPPAQSRLKNKSMDEIITRWASDLSTYQKEFQKQAEKVSVWDRMLVENSEKIQKLYGSTLEAERATTEVERQLTAVENDQAELEIWLDHYERELNQMMSSQVGSGEFFLGPDQERDKTYDLYQFMRHRLLTN